MLEPIKDLFVDHIVLVVSDIERTKAFYLKIFGASSFESDDSVMFQVGSTRVFFVLPSGTLSKGDRFNPNRIGLEHLAFGIKELEDLRRIEVRLNEQNVVHSGMHIDSHSGHEKIWLNDPDGIRIEFFLRVADGV